MPRKFRDDQNLAISGQKLAIFDQIWHLEKFLAYNFQIFLWNLPMFYMKIVIICFSSEKLYSICQENSEMTKIWPFVAKILTKIDIFKSFFTYNFQTPLWIFLIFGMEVVLMVLFEKIILYMPGKFWYGEILAI